MNVANIKYKSKVAIIGPLCGGNPLVIVRLPSQKISNADNVSMYDVIMIM